MSMTLPLDILYHGKSLDLLLQQPAPSQSSLLTGMVSSAREWYQGMASKPPGSVARKQLVKLLRILRCEVKVQHNICPKARSLANYH